MSGTRFAFDDTARPDSPEAVFIHGALCSRADWRFQVEPFAETHRVVRLDLAGHGSSDRTSDPLTIDGFARDVLALCDGLGLRQPVLIGHSMGGRVAMAAAEMAPDRVHRVVMVDTNVVTGDAGRTALQAFEATVSDGSLIADLADTYRIMLGPAINSEVAADVVAAACAVSPATAVETYRALMTWDVDAYEGVLARMRCALRIIQTSIVDADGFRPLEAHETPAWIEAALAGHDDTGFERLPGLRHFPMLEAPDCLNAALRRALGDTDDVTETP